MNKAAGIAQFPSPLERVFAVDEGLALYGQRNTASLQRWYKQIPLGVAIQCETAIHNGALDPQEMQARRSHIDIVIEKGGEKVAAATLGNMIQHILSLDRLRLGPRKETLTEIFENSAVVAVHESRLRVRLADVNKMWYHQVYLTPTGLLLEGPMSDQSNRVLRLYPDHHHHFMRVTFTEEGGQGRRLRKTGTSPVDWKPFLEQHVGKTLNEGFELAGRKWEWLGYSQSALKDHSMIFVSPFCATADGRLVDAASIRQDIGIFDKVIKQPAKYGARIAQVFVFLRLK